MKKYFTLLTIFILICSLSLSAAPKKDKTQKDGQLKKGSPEYYVHQGMFYLNAGNLTLAEENLKMALSKDKENLAALNGLGIVYLQKREFDLATQHFQQVIQINPKYYDAYNFLGVIFSETGQYQLAKENFLMAATAEKYRTPENAYANLAMLEVTNNKIEDAMTYVNKGMHFNKSFAPLHNIKGIILERLKNYERAIYSYEKALSLLTEDDVSYLINLGRAYFKVGRTNKALDTLENAYEKAYTPTLKASIREMIDTIKSENPDKSKIIEVDQDKANK